MAKKSLFITRAEQDEIREVYGDWVADCIGYRGGGLDMDSDPEDVQAAIELEKKSNEEDS